ncbi:hypothetical protein D3C77_785210 [compost metagenome]
MAQGFLNEVEPILAEEQLITDEHARCAEHAAFNRRFGVLLKRCFDRFIVAQRQNFLRVETVFAQYSGDSRGLVKAASFNP